MDIQKFQQKLTEVCELGEKNGKVLKPEQIKECFGELDLDKSQLIKILQYLKLKGISIEGAEEISAASQTGPEEVSEEKEEKVPLTAEEEAYLKEYLKVLKNRSREREVRKNFLNCFQREMLWHRQSCHRSICVQQPKWRLK